jgi:hypothetical protein
LNSLVIRHLITNHLVRKLAAKEDVTLLTPRRKRQGFLFQNMDYVMVKKLLLPLTLIVFSNAATAVYKCKDLLHQKGDSFSGVVYSDVPCANDAEKIDVEEPEWRKKQIEAEIRRKKLIKEEQERQAHRDWLENEKLRLLQKAADEANRRRVCIVVGDVASC